MRIVEQYLTAVAAKLPWKKRKDITDELRSLLLDQIEGIYGEDATEEQAKEFLAGYGSPGAVAAAYKPERPVIAPGLADLYRMILLILAGAMAVAFAVIGVLEFLDEPLRAGAAALRILAIPLRAFQAWLAGVGSVTLVFMGMSRFMKRPRLDVDEDWSVNELKDLAVGRAGESRSEAVVAIGFSLLLIVLLNLSPGIITRLENLFSRTGLGPQHLLALDRFRGYVLVLSVLWTAGIVTRILTLRTGERSRGIEMTEIGLSLAELVLDAVMIADAALFVPVGAGGWIGFKAILAVALVANAGELIGGVFRLVRSRVTGA